MKKRNYVEKTDVLPVEAFCRGSGGSYHLCIFLIYQFSRNGRLLNSDSE